jgi:predicted extracellular nuclease
VDAIKVGFIYKPAKVTLAGNTAALNTGAFGLFNTISGAIQRSRPALAQTFTQNANGDALTVVANHLKSKGSGCEDNLSPVGPDPDAGDGQGNCNLTRKAAAEQLAQWLATNPTGVADPDVLIVGDLNSYAQEDPITALKNAGYINLIEQQLGQNAYSYVFDGQWGYLDHALASPSLAAKVTGVTEWHINADEPAVLDYNTNFKSAGQQTSLFARHRRHRQQHRAAHQRHRHLQHRPRRKWRRDRERARQPRPAHQRRRWQHRRPRHHRHPQPDPGAAHQDP